MDEARPTADLAEWLENVPKLNAPDATGQWHQWITVDDVAARLAAARPAVGEEGLRALVVEGIEAFRLTREYVDGGTPDSTEGALPALPGWSWFDWCEKAKAALAAKPSPAP